MELEPREKLNQFYNQKPKYIITAKYRNITYTLNIYRRLTVIQGLSGKGKTFLMKILGEGMMPSRISTEKSKYYVKSQVEYSVNPEIGGIPETSKIVFLDEDNYYVNEPVLFEELIKSGKYIVIISRNNFKRYSYPVSELYSIDTCLINDNSKKINNNFYRLYDKVLYNNNIPGLAFSKIVVEDSKSGFYFYKDYFKGDVISTNGRSNIIRVVSSILEKDKFINMLIIVDSANFGSDIKALTDIVKGTNTYIMLFECFEFLILESLKIFNNLSNFLNTELMCSSNEYDFNMEKLFEKLLIVASTYVDALVPSKSIDFTSIKDIYPLLDLVDEDAVKRLNYNKNKNISKTFNEAAIKEIQDFIDKLIYEDVIYNRLSWGD